MFTALKKKVERKINACFSFDSEEELKVHYPRVNDDDRLADVIATYVGFARRAFDNPSLKLEFLFTHR